VDVSTELIANHMKVIQSKRVIESALEKSGLAELPSIVSQLDPFETPADYVRSNLYVTSGGGGAAREAHVLNIAFRHTVPEECKTITEALLSEYENFIKETFQDINSEALKLMGDARTELEAEIADLDRQYSEFRMNAPLLGSETGGRDVYTARYEELAAESSRLAMHIDEAAGRLKLVKESLARLQAEGDVGGLSKLSLIDEKNATRLGILVTVERGKAESATFQASQPERVAGANAEYSTLLNLKARLKQLEKEYGANNPETVLVKEQIAEMEKFIRERAKDLVVTESIDLTPDDVMNAYVRMLTNDLEALQRQAEDIKEQLIVAEEEAKSLVALEIENEGLIRARVRREDLYNTVIDRLRNINMQQEGNAPVINEIIEQPEIGEKVEPNLPIALAIFLLTGLTLAGSSIFVAELRDRSVHAPEQLEEIFDCKILGHVANFENDAEMRRSIRKSRSQGSPYDSSLWVHHAPGSKASEGFRALRTQTMFAVAGKNKTIAVTSASQGAGKSTLIANLAISVAGSGRTVLLIDCDLRRPRISGLFGITSPSGVSDLLTSFESDPDEFIVDSGIPGLSVMPSGTPNENPAELLARAEFSHMLESLRGKFDYIFVDCPPILPVADPAIIAPLCDGVLFIATIDRESKPKSERSEKILSGVDAEVIGIVVNRADDARAQYGYARYGYESSEDSDYYRSDYYVKPNPPTVSAK
jgi:polysaccharide biosynthesis transport protein